MIIPKAFEGATEHRFSAKEIFVRPGVTPTDACLLVEGTVRHYDIQPSGDEITLNIYKPGAIMALTWIFTTTENRYFFEAYTDIVLRCLPVEIYKQYLKDNPEQAFALLERLSKGLDGVFTRMAANSYHSAQMRVLNEIRIEAARFGKPDDNGNTVITLAVKEIASRTSLARETVSRTLSKLRADGIIKSRGSHITIL